MDIFIGNKYMQVRYFGAHVIPGRSSTQRRPNKDQFRQAFWPVVKVPPAEPA